jgi:hypothetical protein
MGEGEDYGECYSKRLKSTDACGAPGWGQNRGLGGGRAGEIASASIVHCPPTPSPEIL